MILVEHGPAHHERLVAGRDVADGDGLDAVGEVGLDAVAGKDFGLLGRAHHERDVGAVDVGVDEADALAEAGEGNGQVDGDGGLADTGPCRKPMATILETPGKASGEGMIGECAIFSGAPLADRVLPKKHACVKKLRADCSKRQFSESGLIKFLQELGIDFLLRFQRRCDIDTDNTREDGWICRTPFS